MKLNNYLATGGVLLSLILTACSGSTNNDQTVNQTDTEGQIEVNPSEASNYSSSINPEKSIIRWKGEMLGMYAHEGTVKVKNGYVSQEKGKIFGGSIVVDMRTILPTDENFKPEKGKRKEDLVKHLESPDFFHVDSFPIAGLDLIEVANTNAKGVLWIKKIRGDQSIENLRITEENGIKKITGTMVFDRQHYNVKFQSPVRENVISDKIQLEFELYTLTAEEANNLYSNPAEASTQ